MKRRDAAIGHLEARAAWLSVEGDVMANSNASKDRVSTEVGFDLKPFEAIGRALRAHYDDLLREPLPERFEELLSQLDAQCDAPQNDASQKAKAASE